MQTNKPKETLTKNGRYTPSRPAQAPTGGVHGPATHQAGQGEARGLDPPRGAATTRRGAARTRTRAATAAAARAGAARRGWSRAGEARTACARATRAVAAPTPRSRPGLALTRPGWGAYPWGPPVGLWPAGVARSGYT